MVIREQRQRLHLWRRHRGHEARLSRCRVFWRFRRFKAIRVQLNHEHKKNGIRALFGLSAPNKKADTDGNARSAFETS